MSTPINPTTTAAQRRGPTRSPSTGTDNAVRRQRGYHKYGRGFGQRYRGDGEVITGVSAKEQYAPEGDQGGTVRTEFGGLAGCDQHPGNDADRHHRANHPELPHRVLVTQQFHDDILDDQHPQCEDEVNDSRERSISGCHGAGSR